MTLGLLGGFQHLIQTTTRLAQLVERLTLNQVVEGSSPSVGVLFLSF